VAEPRRFTFEPTEGYPYRVTAWWDESLRGFKAHVESGGGPEGDGNRGYLWIGIQPGLPIEDIEDFRHALLPYCVVERPVADLLDAERKAWPGPENPRERPQDWLARTLGGKDL